MKTGDVLFFRNKTIWSKMIARVTGSPITHTAIAINDKEIIEADGFTPVRIVDLAKSNNNGDCEAVDIGLRISEEELRAKVNHYLNSGYDYLYIISLLSKFLISWLPVIETRHKFTCVELSCEILKECDIYVEAETPEEMYESVKLLAV